MIQLNLLQLSLMIKCRHSNTNDQNVELIKLVQINSVKYHKLQFPILVSLSVPVSGIYTVLVCVVDWCIDRQND